MKKEKKIKTYQRRTKSGKMTTVKAHTAKYDAAEAAKEMAKKKGAGGELEARKKNKNFEQLELPFEDIVDKTKEEAKEVMKEMKSPKSAEKKTAKEIAKTEGKSGFNNNKSFSQNFPKELHGYLDPKNYSLKKKPTKAVEAAFKKAGFGVTYNKVEDLWEPTKGGKLYGEEDYAVKIKAERSKKPDVVKWAKDNGYVVRRDGAYHLRADSNKSSYKVYTLSDMEKMMLKGKKEISSELKGKDSVNSKPQVPGKSSSETSISAADFKEWYRGTGSEADKRVAKMLKAKLGRSGYKKLEDEAIDNYSARGHLSMFKKINSSTEEKVSAPKTTKSSKTTPTTYRETLEKEYASKVGDEKVIAFMQSTYRCKYNKTTKKFDFQAANFGKGHREKARSVSMDDARKTYGRELVTLNESKDAKYGKWHIRDAKQAGWYENIPSTKLRKLKDTSSKETMKTTSKK